MVLHNTLWGVQQSMQAAILVNAVQHWIDSDQVPLVGCKDVTIVNNVAVRSASARRGPLLQIRERTSYNDDNQM